MIKKLENNFKQKKNILIISSVWPHHSNSFEAANTVSFNIVKSLAMLAKFNIFYLYINNTDYQIQKNGKKDIEYLKKKKVFFLKSLTGKKKLNHYSNVLKKLLNFFINPKLLLNGIQYDNEVNQMIYNYKIDMAFVVWSEIGVNALHNASIPKLAYLGNIEHKVLEAISKSHYLTEYKIYNFQKFFTYLKTLIYSIIIKRASFMVLKDFDQTYNVANNDANFYSKNSIKCSYLQNMWPINNNLKNIIKLRNLEELNNSKKIIASVGNLSATGNSLGFIALKNEILPALEQQLKKYINLIDLELHIFGKGKPKKHIEPLLSNPFIKVRGFVDDLDSEILSAPIFLVANNFYDFRVGCTRILHAWSLGACVICFKGSSEAMPEIKNGVNALIGKDGNEIAKLIIKALKDKSLRTKIAKGGYSTLRKDFNSKKIVSKLEKDFIKILNKDN